RTTRPAPNVRDLPPIDLDRLPIAVPPLPENSAEPAASPAGSAEPAARPVPPKAGPPVAPARSGSGRGGQRAGQPRRYAFRRS
ncbi:hypothetical protein, partial [Micromonospora sp. 15K316]|uniref:hypothetical protein n=1 Tax=Micromonospora sp. 15K316 TaxID=2530376 RepID=UPI00352D7F80